MLHYLDVTINQVPTIVVLSEKLVLKMFPGGSESWVAFKAHPDDQRTKEFET